VPKGFAADHPSADLLRFTQFLLFTAHGPASRYSLDQTGRQRLLRLLLPLGSYSLLHVTAVGKVQRLFRTGQGPLMHPRPSSDGKRLAFGAKTFDSNAWMIENF
jgi:hypothetical protein